jgi:Tetratricopeptide repeat
MSLIFNALQRFARTGGDTAGGRQAKPAKRRSLNRRPGLLSPRGVLTLAGVIFITGLLAIQLVQSLCTNAQVKDLSVTPAQASDERQLQAATQSAVDPGPAISAPAPASSVQRTENSSAAGGSPSTGSRPVDAGNASQLVFYPPVPNLAARAAATRPMGGSDGSHFTSAEPAGEQDRTIQKTGPGIPDHLAALRIYNEDELPEARRSQPAAAAPGKTRGDAPPPTAKNSSYQEAAGITAIESNGSLSDAAYHRLEARAAYQLNVTQLSHRIAGAMQCRNRALVSRLMAELEKAQGPDSLFLIRLKAYWQIQQNHLEKARGLLEQVLAQKPDDKESGVNLAVVDMRAGRTESARRRLERLQHLYPEDEEIGVSLQKLRR